MRLNGATLLTNSTREQPRASARLLSHFRALGLTAHGAFTSAIYIITNYADYRAHVHEARTRAR